MRIHIEIGLRMEWKRTLASIYLGKEFEMNTYRTRQAKARDLAIEWQINLDLDKHGWSIWYLQNWYDRFERIGRKYGLLREFRENGIL